MNAEQMSAEQLKRFDRQTRLPMIGLQGQQRLEASVVAILGCGALGSVAAELLARAGVGRLRLIDRDIVEWTNLQRQSLYIEDDARQGRAKADAASERLRQINSQSQYEPWVIDVTSANIEAALTGVDLVVDASDNFGVRMLLNDYSLDHRLPWVHGGCVGTSGQVAFFTGRGGPCFRCLVPEIPPASAVATCDTAGVLGPATHAIASLQSIEVIKWLTGNVATVRQDVWSLDFWANRTRTVKISGELTDSCPACNGGERKFLRGAEPAAAATICGRNAVQISPGSPQQLDLQRLAHHWKNAGIIESNRFFSRLRLTSELSLTVFRDGRTIVDGTTDLTLARSLQAKWIGG